MERLLNSGKPLYTDSPNDLHILSTPRGSAQGKAKTNPVQKWLGMVSKAVIKK